MPFFCEQLFLSSRVPPHYPIASSAVAKRVSEKQMLMHCESIGPEDGFDPRDVIRSAQVRKSDRKSVQLCRQVEKTLTYVLSGELNDDCLRDLWVVSVRPAPHSHHLLTTVQVPAVESPEQLLAIQRTLLRYKGVIRSAIAADIHRRKTPDVSFQVVNP